MNWADIGGRTKSLHVVVKWNFGINVRILCKHFIVNHARVKETHRQLPHCKHCIDVLKKLIKESNETVQLEFSPSKVDYPASTRIKEMQSDMRRRRE